MTERKYLPTLSDLIDRLIISQMKAIFIHEKKDEYLAEMSLITHDIDLILGNLDKRIGAKEVREIIVLTLANRFIWENEAWARNGGSDKDYSRLKATHSINGVRATAKNMLAELDMGRRDYKIDCFAAELVEEFGNWDVFPNGGTDQVHDDRGRPTERGESAVPVRGSWPDGMVTSQRWEQNEQRSST